VPASLAAPLAHPVRNAVSRKRIAVPLQEPTLGRSREVNQSALAHGPQTTETLAPFADDALVAAERALNSIRIPWGSSGQVECRSGIAVRCFASKPRRQRAGTTAGGAQADGRCYACRDLMTAQTVLTEALNEECLLSHHKHSISLPHRCVDRSCDEGTFRFSCLAYLVRANQPASELVLPAVDGWKIGMSPLLLPFPAQSVTIWDLKGGT